MKIIAVVIGIVMITGCVSLTDKVYRDVHLGDSESHVTEVLGSPSRVSPSRTVEGGTAYYYDADRESCGIVIKDNVVAYKKCRYKKENWDIDYDALSRAGTQLSKGFSGASDQPPPSPPGFVPVKQTDYGCFNNCTAHGHQLGYCQSKCSY